MRTSNPPLYPDSEDDPVVVRREPDCGTATPASSRGASVSSRRQAFSGVPPAESGDATAPAPPTRKRGAARSGRNTRWHAPAAPLTPGPVRGPSIPRTARVTVPGFYTRGAREPTVMGGGAIGPARGEERDGIASLVGLRRSGRTASSGCASSDSCWPRGASGCDAGELLRRAVGAPPRPGSACDGHARHGQGRAGARGEPREGVRVSNRPTGRPIAAAAVRRRRNRRNARVSNCPTASGGWAGDRPSDCAPHATLRRRTPLVADG